METAFLSFAPAVALAVIHQHHAQWPSTALIQSRIPLYGFAFAKWPSEWWRLLTCMFIHESDGHLFDNVCDITSTYWIIFIAERALDTGTMLRDATVGIAGGLVAGFWSYCLHQEHCVEGTVKAAGPVKSFGTVLGTLASVIARVAEKTNLRSSSASHVFYCGAEPIVGVIRGFHLALRPQVSLAIPAVGRLAVDTAHFLWWRFLSASPRPENPSISLFLKDASWFRRWNTDMFGQHCGVIVGIALGLAWRAVSRGMHRQRGVANNRQAVVGGRGYQLPLPHPIVLPASLDGPNPRCPPEFYCPLSRCLMVDPVVTADGQTYERASIEHWFQLGHTTSPVTNLALPYLDVTPNFALRQIMTDWQ